MRIVVVVVLLLVLAVAGTAHGAAQAACDAATATPLIQEPDTNPRVVDAVHCGAFLGPGSEAMLVVIAPQGGCVRVAGWRMFVRADGGWQGVGDEHDIGFLTVTGTTIVERREIHRRGDWSYCGGATGGEQERTWSWNGTAFAAGAWTQTVPARPKGEVARFPRGEGASFFAVGRFQCYIQDARRGAAGCSYRRTPISWAEINAAGRLRTCDDMPEHFGCNIGNAGEGDVPYTLRANQSVVVGRFRCRAGRTSMRCTVVKTGKGFTIGRNGPRAIR